MRIVFKIAAVCILTAVAFPVWARSTAVLKCVDGDPDSLAIASRPPLDLGTVACDGDGVRNASCTFLSACPACALSTPACLAPCFVEPHYVLANVRIGRRLTVTLGPRTLVFRCDSVGLRRHR